MPPTETKKLKKKGDGTKGKKGKDKKDKKDKKEKGPVDDHGAFRPGAKIMVEFRDGSVRLAVVIERRPHNNDTTKTLYDYYIHYKGLNSRMDEWVTPNRVKSTPEEVLAAEKGRLEELARIEALKNEKKTEDEEDVVEYIDSEHDESHGMDEASLKEHEEWTKVKNVNFLELGRFIMETWYFSPFPKEYYPDGTIEMLYFNEFTLDFFRHRDEMLRSRRRTTRRHPPGNEIYRYDGIAMFEVDGAVEPHYCENLCYLAKLFLDHKTLMYDVRPFFFYVMCEVDQYGYHITGYFSKEKYSEEGFNLACILTLPCYQRKGYGRMLIQFSYELSKIEKKVGSPEKPLSDLGLLSYRSYWSWVLLGLLKDVSSAEISIMDLAELTSMTTDDIIGTLQYLNMLHYVNGSHIIRVDREEAQAKFDKQNAKPGPRCRADRIHWAPYKMPSRRDKWTIRAKWKMEKEG